MTKGIQPICLNHNGILIAMRAAYFMKFYRKITHHDSINMKALKREEEHKRRHSNFVNPEHQHTPRRNYRGALEDGEEEKVS